MELLSISETPVKNYNLEGPLSPEDVEVGSSKYGGKDFPGWQANRDAEGRLHSEDGKPALVRADGTQEWYEHGKLHRPDDLPARIRPDGRTELWKDGSSYFLQRTPVSASPADSRPAANRAERRKKRKRG